MLRMVFISVFLSLYILILGPPLLLYTLVTRHIDPLYWAGLKGVMFFVRAAGVRVRVEGREKIPRGVCLFVANHTSSADAPAVVGAIPRRIAVLLQEFKKGAVVLGIKAGVPIVPVLCSGAQRVMAKRSMVIHPGEILVEFLEPIDAAKYTWEERDVLNQAVHDAMAAGLPPDQRPIGFPGAA